MPRVAPDDGEWPEVLKGSNNGFFMVVIALGWWAQGVKFAELDMNAWDQATADATWVVDQMKLVAVDSRKRTRDDVDDGIDSENLSSTSRPDSKRYVCSVRCIFVRH